MKKIFYCLIFIGLLPSISFAKYCKDFKTHQEAQAYFKAKKPGYKRLDRDGDGFACDCLPGGNGKKCPKAKNR
ncbi:excalibur calcium-binding domain-containing protein [Acinetobacter sp. TGL-Y2]|uniref:excalibur calcium-binding domain-containing protein n=1 Tax=Acinetobacter sp. TGL-Y2 TaxID=1407071 RepID=UPI0019065651|nr:excalibur calcium-binding domain-containing protein [Acinetobacter sp. TGL-Y2]MBJ9373729.1 excalibur calcium-binding domain-containing protein [Acinetobacter sp. TGL-Y2]